MALKISSAAFKDNGSIPIEYTCQGEDVSPPLQWEGAPAGTESFVLIIDDPDAPDPKAPQMTWVHWVVFNIPKNVNKLEKNITFTSSQASEGMNDFKKTSYGGPCPPIGEHRYFHKLYALDTMLKDFKSHDKNGVLEAMKGHVLAESVLVGLYEKKS